MAPVLQKLVRQKSDPLQWMSEHGYTFEINHISDLHTLTKGSTTIQIQGAWDEWLTMIQDKSMQKLLAKMLYISNRTPSIVFPIKNKSHWPDLLMDTEKNWLSESKNLLRRVIERGDKTPTRLSQSITGSVICTFQPASISYLLIGPYNGASNKSDQVLQISVQYKYNSPSAQFTPEDVLSYVGIPKETHELLNDPWSPEWWNHVRSFFELKNDPPAEYDLPLDMGMTL